MLNSRDTNKMILSAGSPKIAPRRGAYYRHVMGQKETRMAIGVGILLLFCFLSIYQMSKLVHIDEPRNDAYGKGSSRQHSASISDRRGSAAISLDADGRQQQANNATYKPGANFFKNVNKFLRKVKRRNKEGAINDIEGDLVG